VLTRTDTVLAATPGTHYQVGLRLLWSSICYELCWNVLLAQLLASLLCHSVSAQACNMECNLPQVYFIFLCSTGFAAFRRCNAPVYLLQKQGAATHCPEARTPTMHMAAAMATPSRQWSQVRPAGYQACGHPATCR